MKSFLGKFLKTFAPGDTIDGLVQKVDESIAAYNKLQADFTALKTKYLALLAKLDLDAGVTDTNYAALETPAATTSAQVAINMSNSLIPSPPKQGI